MIRMYISMGVCESLSKRWNEEKDPEKKKELTIESWFLHFYSVQAFGIPTV